MRGFSYQDDETWLQRTFRWITRNVFRRSSLPITDDEAKAAAKFVRDTYGQKIVAATTETPFSAPLLAAIICQETAYFWMEFMHDLPPAQLNARCVLDASGADTWSDRLRLLELFACPQGDQRLEVRSAAAPRDGSLQYSPRSVAADVRLYKCPLVYSMVNRWQEPTLHHR